MEFVGEVGESVVINGQDTDTAQDVNDDVSAGLAIGPDDFVADQFQPRIAVDALRFQNLPWSVLLHIDACWRLRDTLTAMDTLNPRIWQIRSGTLTLDRPLVMGIVNVTPDSFSDGGQWFDPGVAVEHALRLVAEGADILDIGGESTRPGAEAVPVEEELRRVVPVVAAIARQTQTPISIDTMKPGVALACLDAGAAIVNDVAGLGDPAMVDVVHRAQCGAVVMHMQGTPQTMQIDPRYDDIVAEVGDYFDHLLQELNDTGIDPNFLAIDPGIGFGKKSEHNWQLLAGLKQFQRFGRPLVLGVSRKGFLGKERPPTERAVAGVAIACHAMTEGAVQVIRTHDVAMTRDAIDSIQKIQDCKR